MSNNLKIIFGILVLALLAAVAFKGSPVNNLAGDSVILDRGSDTITLVSATSSTGTTRTPQTNIHGADRVTILIGTTVASESYPEFSDTYSFQVSDDKESSTETTLVSTSTPFDNLGGSSGLWSTVVSTTTLVGGGTTTLTVDLSKYTWNYIRAVKTSTNSRNVASSTIIIIKTH